MPVRKAVLAASVLSLALVLNLATASAARPKPDRTAPNGPTNLRITASGPTSMSLAWDAGNDNSSNWWYCLQRDGLGCIRVDPPQTTFTFAKLWPDTTFNYSVIAIDANGNRSAPSNTVTYTTPPDTTPPTAPTLSLTATWPTRIGVAWTTSTDNVSQVWYTLLVDGAPYGSDMIGARSSLVLDRSPETTYTFKVTVRDYFGNVNESNALSVTTPAVTDFEAPTVPTNLRLSSETGDNEIWLDWDQSTDNSDPQSLILYEFFLNGVLADRAMGSGEGLVYCLGPGPTTIKMRATDTSGNTSAFGNEITHTC